MSRVLAFASISLLSSLLSFAAPALAESDGGPSALAKKSGPVETGKPFPSFAGWGLDGTMVSLKKLLERPKGAAEPTRAVVVTFFATWCKPCKKNLPPLARAVAAAGPGVKVVLVDYGPEEPEKVKEFVADLKLESPVLLDPYLKVSGRCGVTDALPRTFVVDGKGNLAAIFVHEGADFEQALGAELAKIAPSGGGAVVKAGTTAKAGEAVMAPAKAQ